MSSETLGASFSIDVTNLKAGLAQANRLIKESESEFKAAAAGMDDWTQSSDGLNAKIKSLNSITEVQREKVNALQSEYDRLIADGLDPTSKQAVELRTKINNETAALNKNEAELENQTQALKDLENNTEEAGDATEEMGNKFEGLKAVGGAVVGAIAAVGAACVAAVGSFLSLAESTRESRENMAKLETAFYTAGHSAGSSIKTYKELYGILGDEGQATEAAAHLAQLTNNQEELAAWTNIATGVYATFGDSLPIEGLTEAANETAKTGALTGGLADALNWAGVSEDEFQESLDACSTEQERQALITETLNGLYSDAADVYRAQNKEIIESRNAQLQLNAALDELGAIAEPIMTTLKYAAADLLSAITPFVELIGKGLTDALNGADGAAETLAEGLTGVLSTVVDKIVEIAPFVIETVLAIFPTLLSSILEQLPSLLQTVIDAVVSAFPNLLTTILAQLPSILQTLLTMVAQVASALGGMLPTLIPVIIDAVIMLAETLLDNIDMIIDAGISLLVGLADGIVSALPQLVAKAPVIISKLVTAISNNLPKLLQTGVSLIVELGGGLIKAIPQLVSKIPQIISSIVSGLKSGVSSIASVGSDLIRGLWNGISDMASWIYDKISGFGDSILDSLKSFFGIASPSKVMADIVGKNLALGIGKGFTENIGAVNDEITDAMNFESASFNVNASRNGGGAIGGGVTVYQTNNYSQAHSRYELYKTKQQTAAAVRLAMVGAG